MLAKQTYTLQSLALLKAFSTALVNGLCGSESLALREIAFSSLR